MALSGVLSGASERFPPGLYLRETPLTLADEAIKTFARGVAGNREPLDSLHALMGMAQLGYKRMRSLEGGICAWDEQPART